MNIYNYYIVNVEYHPDDTPEYYLPEKLSNDIISILKKDVKTERGLDTLVFIRVHEETQRNVASGKIDREEQKRIINEMAKDFSRKHGDCVHHENELYKSFYEKVKLLSSEYD